MTTARVTDAWLPLPESVLKATGWREGDSIEVEVLDPDTLLLTRQPATPVEPRVGPVKGRRIRCK